MLDDSSASPIPRAGPLRDRHLRYRVLHVAALTAAPTNPAAHRRHLALGTGNRHRLAPYPHRIHLTANPDRRDKDLPAESP